MNTVTLDSKGLQALKRQLKTAGRLTAQVGIFSDHAGRVDDPNDVSGLNNVEIGAKHEFGSVSEGIPARSFLEMRRTVFM